MSRINDLICRRKVWCDRYAKHHNLFNAGLCAILIDIILPLVAIGIGVLGDFIGGFSLSPPIGVIVDVANNVLGTVAIALVFGGILVCLLLLFREIGVFSVIAIVPIFAGLALVGSILLIVIVGLAFVIGFLLLQWSWLAGIGAILGIAGIFLALVGTALVLWVFFLPWATVAITVRYAWDRISGKKSR